MTVICPQAEPVLPGPAAADGLPAPAEAASRAVQPQVATPLTWRGAGMCMGIGGRKGKPWDFLPLDLELILCLRDRPPPQFPSSPPWHTSAMPRVGPVLWGLKNRGRLQRMPTWETEQHKAGMVSGQPPPPCANIQKKQIVKKRRIFFFNFIFPGPACHCMCFVSDFG